MDKGNQLNFIKFDKNNSEQIEFLKQHLRSFYTRDIAIWQYENDKVNTGLFLAQDNGNYIASQGMIPLYLNVKGNQTLTAKSETSFLLPEFRGKGIFENLYFYTIKKSEEDNVKFFWGFTALSKVWRNKLLFDVYDGIIHESELQISFFNSICSIGQSKQPFTSKAKLSIKSFFALTNQPKLQKSGKKYNSVQLQKENQSHIVAILELYKKWQKEHPNFISVFMNEDFLNWRIFNNPVANYNVFGVYKNNDLVCVGIVNVGSNKSYLVDFIALDTEDISECLNEIIILLKKNKNISHLTYWASSINAYTKTIHTLFLSKGALQYINNSMNFVIRKAKNESQGEFDLTEYCINGLWTEGFKI